MAARIERANRRLSCFPWRSDGSNTEVRHILGVGRKAGPLVIAEPLKADMQLAFCKCNAAATKLDLLRVGGEVRAQAEAAGGITGALTRGLHFGERQAEFSMVREASARCP